MHCPCSCTSAQVPHTLTQLSHSPWFHFTPMVKYWEMKTRIGLVERIGVGEDLCALGPRFPEHTHTHTQSFLSFWALSPYKNRPHSHFQFFFSSLHPLCMRTNLAGSRRRRHSPSLSCPQLVFFLQVAGFRFLGKANPPFHCVLLPSPLLPHLSHNPPNCSQEHTAKNAAKLLARILGDFY